MRSRGERGRKLVELPGQRVMWISSTQHHDSATADGNATVSYRRRATFSNVESWVVETALRPLKTGVRLEAAFDLLHLQRPGGFRDHEVGVLLPSPLTARSEEVALDVVRRKLVHSGL